MHSALSLSELVVLLALAASAGFGFAVGMSAFELACSLLWSFF